MNVVCCSRDLRFKGKGEIVNNKTANVHFVYQNGTGTEAHLSAIVYRE